MSKRSKLIFFGNERLATGVSTNAPTLRMLIEHGYEVCAVVVSHTEAVSRNKRGLEVVEVAHAYHIPVIIPERMEDILPQLNKYGAQAGVLVAFGQIIPRPLIDIFSRGIINIHPSLLPAYRGPTPIETAILDGIKETGVTLMSLSPKMDAGPIYRRVSMDIYEHETKPQLAKQLLKLGGQLLSESMEAILDGSLEAIPQDPSEATYTKLIGKGDGQVDFAKPAERIEREVRAYLGWPKSRAQVHGQDVIITKARVAKDANDGHLVIKCRPGWLEIEELTGPSGRSMSGADFLRGYKKT